MKIAVWMALAGLAVPLAAHGESAFSTAATTPSWAGCVYQPGFSPYPISLTARGRDFFVSYPEQDCLGGHNAGFATDEFDATEIIVVDTARRCINMLPVRYSFDAGSLRIDYFGEAGGTFALLRPAVPGATPPACDQAEAVS